MKIRIVKHEINGKVLYTAFDSENTEHSVRLCGWFEQEIRDRFVSLKNATKDNWGRYFEKNPISGLIVEYSPDEYNEQVELFSQTVACLDSFQQSQQSVTKKCICPLSTLMSKGCQCGGK